MEWLTIIVTSLLTILTPAGLIIDRVIADTIRSQVEDVETLAIRLDNVPTHQILQGKIERIRMASRGVYPIKNFRIEAIEVETDPIDIDLQRLQNGNNRFSEALRQPAQGAIRLVLKEDDINNALQSPEIKSQLQQFINTLVPQREDRETQPFEILNIKLDFLENNRIRFQIQLQQTRAEGEAPEPFDLNLEVGINIINGRTIELLEPSGTLNGRRLSSRLLKGFAEGLTERLDLRSLEEDGIIARIIQLKIDNQDLQLATFIRIEPQ